MTRAAHQTANVVRLRRLGIDTYQEPVLFLGRSSPICRAEGWEAQARVDVSYRGRTIVATLNVTTDGLLGADEASLSEVAWQQLGAENGALAHLAHSAPVESLSALRAKVYGETPSASALASIIRDITAGRYSDIDLAAYVTAFAGQQVDPVETAALTRAMVDGGERLYWGQSPIVDKHCVGGLPGNRTSMIVVPIVAACGLTIPKTSSRAITSPAGTADAMETVAPVDLDLAAMRRVVEREGACIVWGGRVRLAPADDIIISVERPLDFDSPTQLVASILSKKCAAGSSHVVIDMPVGPTTKVRTAQAANVLQSLLEHVAADIGLTLRVVRSDGLQPVGHGIGPALEARDVLSVLRRDADAPEDLRARALALAGDVLELGGAAAAGCGQALAAETLTNGHALKKFEAICAAQGGARTPPSAPLSYVVRATRAGRLMRFDNRRLGRLAKLAGAPHAPSAGIDLHVRLDEAIDRDQPLLTIHAETPGEMDYARDYLAANLPIIEIDEFAGPTSVPAPEGKTP